MKKTSLKLCATLLSLVFLLFNFNIPNVCAQELSSSLIVGDITRDEKVDVLDLVRLKKITVGLANAVSVADINEDDAIDSSDILILRKIIILGVANYDPFTVVFLDGDTVLSKQKVTIGSDATAPTLLPKKGYTFVGWDKEFTSVGRDLTVNAVYEKAFNQFFFDFAEDENGNITVQMFFAGEVDLKGAEFNIDLELDGYEFSEITYINDDTIVDLSDKDRIFCSYSGMTALENELHVLTAVFIPQKDSGNIVLNLNDIDVFDDNFNDCVYTVGHNKFVNSGE